MVLRTIHKGSRERSGTTHTEPPSHHPARGCVASRNLFLNFKQVLASVLSFLYSKSYPASLLYITLWPCWSFWLICFLQWWTDGHWSFWGQVFTWRNLSIFLGRQGVQLLDVKAHRKLLLEDVAQNTFKVFYSSFRPRNAAVLLAHQHLAMPL